MTPGPSNPVPEKRHFRRTGYNGTVRGVKSPKKPHHHPFVMAHMRNGGSGPTIPAIRGDDAPSTEGRAATMNPEKGGSCTGKLEQPQSLSEKSYKSQGSRNCRLVAAQARTYAVTIAVRY